MRRASGALALSLLLLLAGPPGRAEVRRLEAVGAVPVNPSRVGGSPPRDAAILEAQREAVSRVAHELLIDAELPEDFEDRLEEVLGKDMVRYTTRFRILEDQGVRRALFAEDPEVNSEYVLVVEVYVDLDRVRARLEEAGWLAPADGAAAGRRLWLEVEGLRGFAAYQALTAALKEGAGARSVVPVEFERDRILLQVNSEYAAEELLEKLLPHLPPELSLLPVEIERDRLRLRGSWSAPSEAEETGATAEGRSAPARPEPRGSR